MSKHVVSLVYRKKIGSMMRKAVLSYMADRANDDGSGIWCSKQTIANEIEASRQGVIKTIKALVDRECGILIEVGERKCANGFTIEYKIDLQKLHALPFITGKNIDATRKEVDPSKSAPVNDVDVTRQPRLRDSSTPFTQTSLNRPKPSINVDLEKSFDEIWSVWSTTGRQRSKSKEHCQDALKRQSKHLPLEAIVLAAKHYAKLTEGRFHKGLHTWLTGGFYKNWVPKSMDPSQPSEATHNGFTIDAWANLMRDYCETGLWENFAGPAPHEADCRAPANMIEHAAKLLEGTERGDQMRAELRAREAAELEAVA